jgi:hypothetical protein
LWEFVKADFARVDIGAKVVEGAETGRTYENGGIYFL